MNTPTQKPQQSVGPMNVVFALFMGLAIVSAAFSGEMEQLTKVSFEAAKSAVTLALGLVGIMALWLGLVRILEAGGFMFTLARLVKPIMTRLFKDVPADHPAMGAMLLNISANMLGLGNAATPMGIKAMHELDKLNKNKGTATDAMCLFLAINTSGVSLLPLGVIGVRAAAGALEPSSVLIPSLLATSCSTIVGVSAALFLARLAKAKERDGISTANPTNSLVSDQQANQEADQTELLTAEPDTSNKFIRTPGVLQRGYSWLLLGLTAAAFVSQLIKSDTPTDFLTGPFLAHWLMPILMLLILCYGLNRGVKLYEAVTDGAKQGFDVAIKIIPFLVAILVAIAMFKESSAFTFLVSVISPYTQLIGLPAEVLPLALIRPLSGTGAFAVMSAIVNADPNSYASYVASTVMGSTETTFYVMAVYFGAVGVTKIRYALAAGLAADISGVLAASLICKFTF